MATAAEHQQDDPATAVWQCQACGFVYDPTRGDPDGGIEPGTPFDAIPEDWVCPSCGAAKADFAKLAPGATYDDMAAEL